MREQILAMKPGRELDALVAEKVMGWTGVGPDVDAEIYGWPSGHNKELGVYWVPHYSTDISAAYEVVEMMRDSKKRAFTIELYGIMNPNREAFQIVPIDLIWYMNPLNISKAALLAVMEA